MSDASAPKPPGRRRLGCLFWSSAALILIFGTVAGAIFYAMYWVRAELEKASSPVAIPVPTSHDAALAEVRAKLDDALVRLDAGADPGADSEPDSGADSDDEPRRASFAFSVDELNTLIAEDAWSKKQELPGRVRVLSIAGGLVSVQITWPLDELSERLFGSDDLEGLHLNARLGVLVAAEDGSSTIRVSEGEVVGGAAISSALLGLIGEALTRSVSGALESEGVTIEKLEAESGVLSVEATRS